MSGVKLEAPLWWRILSLGRKLHTYAIVQILGRWGDTCSQVNPSTAIDKVGENNPEWNPCFFFTGVDSMVIVDRTKYRDSIKIYVAATWFMLRDQVIGETSFYMNKVLYKEGAQYYNLDKGTGTGTGTGGKILLDFVQ